MLLISKVILAMSIWIFGIKVKEEPTLPPPPIWFNLKLTVMKRWKPNHPIGGFLRDVSVCTHTPALSLLLFCSWNPWRHCDDNSHSQWNQHSLSKYAEHALVNYSNGREGTASVPPAQLIVVLLLVWLWWLEMIGLSSPPTTLFPIFLQFYFCN